MNLENTYVIGDVHGCFNTLIKLLKQLPQNANLIFVGDLCDKGNFSKETIEFVINNNHTYIKGNHEYLFYNYARDAILRDKHGKWTSSYGGMKTINNYKDKPEILQKHIKIIETLPHYIQIGKYFITHGFGLPYYDKRDNKQYAHKLLTNRIDTEYEKSDWEDTNNLEIINIFGHCKFDNILVGTNYYGIDTGCVYGNKLTAIQLGTLKVFQEDLDKRDVLD